MATYWDENYGQWTIESPEDIAHYRKVQKESRRKRCQGCARMVRLRPDYALCNACADRQERGWDCG